MHLDLLTAWIVGVTSFTLVGSFYARRYEQPDFLVGLYVTFVLTSQILATKVAYFDIGFAQFSAPAGVLVFAVTFLLTDIVNERFGRSVTQRMIFTALVSQIAMSLFLLLGTKFDPDLMWASTHNVDAWNTFFGMVPRIMIASWIAFFVSENIDAFVYSWFKRLTKGHHLWMRNLFSVIPALIVDSFLFVPIAFWGVPGFPLIATIKGQMILKWIVGVIDIPFMYFNYAILMREEDILEHRRKEDKLPS